MRFSYIFYKVFDPLLVVSIYLFFFSSLFVEKERSWYSSNQVIIKMYERSNFIAAFHYFLMHLKNMRCPTRYTGKMLRDCLVFVFLFFTKES